jgi:hypothetical protein
MEKIHAFFKKYSYPLLLLAGLLLLTLISSIFVHTFSSMKQRGDFKIRHELRVPPTPETIERWMTFDYLNKSFSLPNSYLKNELSITNSSYPNITIKKAALSSSEDIQKFLNRVTESINAYSKSSEN